MKSIVISLKFKWPKSINGFRSSKTANICKKLLFARSAIKSNSSSSKSPTCTRPMLRLLFVEISMGNFLMFWNCSKLEASSLKTDTCLLEILLIEVIIQLKQFNFFSVISSNILKTSFYFEEIINQGRSQLFMDFTTRLSKNMVARLLGNILMKLLTICHSELSSKTKFFASTEAFRRKLKQ